MNNKSMPAKGWSAFGGKKYIVFVLPVLMFALLAAPMVQAQVGTCRVRADLTAAEVTALTGGAQTAGVPAGTSLDLTGSTAGDNSLLCGFSLIKWVANVLFVIIIVVAILLLAYAAFLFVSSGGDPKKRDKAKSVLIWAIVGLLVASLARLIPGIAQTLLVS